MDMETRSRISFWLQKYEQKFCFQSALTEIKREKEWGRMKVMVTMHAVQKKQKSTLGVAAISMETKGRQQLSFLCTHTTSGPVVEVVMATDWWRTWEAHKLLLGCLFCRSHPRQRWSVRHPGDCGAAEGYGRSQKRQIRGLIIIKSWTRDSLWTSHHGGKYSCGS